MAEVFVAGKRYRLNPSNAIGKGGEADVYDIGNGLVLKLFKPPSHPDLVGDPAAQHAAKMRLAEHQRKLPVFPKNLPARVVSPQALATDSKGLVVGYTMPYLKGAEVLLRYTQRKFRQGIPQDEMRAILLDMHATVLGIHKAKVVIGDFNDLNVLVKGTEASFIDADSMQYGGFHCMVYTARFVDPLLCDPRENSMHLIRPHTESSDWYAFNIMTMQCFLFVDPYGGIYKPKDHRKTVLHNARPLKRVTVFHPEVVYPKPAIPYGMLPDDLLQHFHEVFERDKREAFPLALLQSLRWTKCLVCGVEHARDRCPNCATAAPAAIKQVVEIRGQVTATRLFKTTGTIIRAQLSSGTLLWLYHENGAFRREDRSVVVAGALDPQLRYRLQGSSTLLGKRDSVVKLMPLGPAERFSVDSSDNRPIFDTNGQHVYWAQSGQLFRDEKIGPEYIGDVLQGQTHFWAGPNFGFGFYRAGQLSVAFVFGATTRGINDSIQLPPLRGKLVDATCVFTKDRCWFMTTTQEGSRLVNRCSVITASGVVEASTEAEYDDGSWLSRIRGGAAAGKFLLVPTDEGVVRVDMDSGSFQVTKRFPDTEPFVDSASQLFAASDGLYVVQQQEIIKLVIK